MGENETKPPFGCVLVGFKETIPKECRRPQNIGTSLFLLFGPNTLSFDDHLAIGRLDHHIRPETLGKHKFLHLDYILSPVQ